MRVSSINAAGMGNMAFGKVVKLNTEPALYNMYIPKIDPQTSSIVDIIEGKKPKNLENVYFNLLHGFLCDKIGDYSKKEGLVAEKICGDVYVFTGKEAAAAREITDKADENEALHSWSQAQLKKDIELSDIIGRAKHAGAYDEIDADFNDKGELETIAYKDVLNTK